jgi:hypothetical protein
MMLTMTGVSQAMLRTAILAVGLVLAGWFVGHGFARGRSADRYVTVKGVSEREVRANLALWPLRIVATDNDLARAQTRIATSVQEIRRFLVRNRVDTAGVELQGYEVNDAYANQFRSSGEVGNRYVIRQTVMVRSEQPDVVLAASQRVGELVDAGVVLSSGGEYGSGGPTFLFTQLNTLKPQMIAEATARARESAQQFARDSRSALGGIRTASQGMFEILPRDQAPGVQEESQLVKIVRVVSTVEYFLRD